MLFFSCIGRREELNVNNDWRFAGYIGVLFQQAKIYLAISTLKLS